MTNEIDLFMDVFRKSLNYEDLRDCCKRCKRKKKKRGGRKE